jgi:hypothetical protein
MTKQRTPKALAAELDEVEERIAILTEPRRNGDPSGVSSDTIWVHEQKAEYLRKLLKAAAQGEE